MHVIVTGANGFIGSHLVASLIRAGRVGGKSISRLTVLDFNLDQVSNAPIVHKILGSYTDSAVLDQALDQPVDVLFHLASAPSGLCESNPTLGIEVNVAGMINLLTRLERQTNTPRLVFSSSIAVYGKPHGPYVDDETPPDPTLTYGAHKVIGEVLISDYSRRGVIDGISLRPPGIVTRPPEPNGAVSIFFSDLIRELANARPFTCPVSPTSQSWLLSIGACIENLITAATIDSPKRRTWTMPSTTVVIEDLVAAIASHTRNPDVFQLVSYAPDPWVQFNFASYPPLHLPKAAELGFRADVSLEALVTNSLP